MARALLLRAEEGAAVVEVVVAVDAEEAEEVVDAEVAEVAEVALRGRLVVVAEAVVAGGAPAHLVDVEEVARVHREAVEVRGNPGHPPAAGCHLHRSVHRVATAHRPAAALRSCPR